MGQFSEAVLNKMLNAVAARADYTQEADVYIQLHTGDPGSNGTANVATENTRQLATFGDAAESGAISNTDAITWTNLAATETLTHISLWSASTNGTFLGSDDLSASKNVNIGDTYTIPIGDLELSL